MRIPARTAAALCGAALVLTGCSVFAEPPEPIRLTAPPSVAPSAPAPTTPSFTIVDSMFAQMMIPHHEQALEMAALVPERTTTPEVVALAAEIAAAQESEIEQLRGWLAGWGLESDVEVSDHLDHAGMEGMLTEAELSALRDAEGAQFDRLWLEGMIRHHEGAVTMAETVVASGVHLPTKALAEEIIRTQEAEIARMQAMLGR